MADTHSIAEKMHFSEPTTKMKPDLGAAKELNPCRFC